MFDSIWVWASIESESSERRGLISYQVRENSIFLSKNMSRWCMGHGWNLCQPISSKWPFEWLEFLSESLIVQPLEPRYRSVITLYIALCQPPLCFISHASGMAIWMARSVIRSVSPPLWWTKIFHPLLDELPWNVVPTFMVLRGWIFGDPPVLPFKTPADDSSQTMYSLSKDFGVRTVGLFL